MRNLLQQTIEAIGLQTSTGRLLFFLIATIVIFLLPVSALAEFSIWQKLGVPSPSIGLTRAYHHILHGNIDFAWQQNRLIFVVLLIGLPLLAKDVYNVSKKIAQKE